MPYAIARTFIYIYAVCFASMLIYNGLGMRYLLPSILGLLALPVIAGLLWQRRLPPLGVAGTLVLSFGLWCVASMLWSQSPDASFVGMIRVSMLSVGFFALTMLLHMQGKERPVAELSAPLWRLLLALVFIFSLFPILDQLVVGKPVRSGGLLYDANLGANLINLVNISLLLVLIFAKLSKLKYTLIYIVFVISFLGFAYGNSRSAMLGLLPALLLFAAMGIYKFGWLRALDRAILPSVAMLLSLWVARTGSGSGVLERLSSTADEIQSGQSLRLYLLRAAWHIYKEHPLLGSGIYTFQDIYPSLRIEPLERSYYVHNDYMQILMELGPIGLLLFLSLLALCLFFIYKSARGMLQEPNSKHGVLLALNLWLLAFFIQATVYFEFYNSNFALPAGWVLALGNYAYLQKPAKDKQQNLHILRPAIAVALLAYVVSNFMDDYYLLNEARIRNEMDFNSAHRIEQINLGKSYPKWSLSQLYFMAASQDISMPKRKIALDYSLQNICQYLQKNPYKYQAVNLLANIYAYYDQLQLKPTACAPPLPQDKFAAIERAIDLAPFDTYSYYATWEQWLQASKADPKEMQRLKYKQLATRNVILDFANNDSWERARSNAVNMFDYYMAHTNELISKYNKTIEGNFHQAFFQKLFVSVDDKEAAGN